MSGLTIRGIACDGWDGPGPRDYCKAFRYGNPGQGLADLRASAATEGWDAYRPGRDLCPKHADVRRELLSGGRS